MTEYLNLVNPNVPFTLQEPEHPFTFPLDNFQKYALYAISKHENVLVTAKTGSGKTLVGEYQIHVSLNKNKKVIYTTPIKSLSNQKFNDLKKIYGDRVGIITGDIKFNPQGDILIMTTEILRNLLYKENSVTSQYGTTAGVSLNNLDAVIFDEVHYINDPSRGKVWEETLILLPSTVNLVLLSATIDSPEVFASWLGKIKQKMIHCISTTYRIVPLTHYVINNQKQLVEIMDSKNNFNKKCYKDWLNEKQELLKDHDKFKETVKNREEGQVISKTARIVSFQHTLNETIEILSQKELLPALFFVFSRKACEKYAQNVQGSLIDSSDAAAVKNIIRFHLHSYMDRLEHLSQYHTLFDLMCRGIAFHHSGLLPILKEMIEILFNRGYIKVLFATETFSVGINMPTKTVVFLEFRKHDDKTDNPRVLRTDEYLQMAGRAGRRGIDTLGVVIYLPIRNPLYLNDCCSMMTGKNSSIVSRMDFHYDFILKAIHSNKHDFNNIFELSYYEYQNVSIRNDLKQEIERLIQNQNKLSLSDYLPDLKEKYEIEQTLKICSKDALKQHQTKLNTWNNKHMGPKWLEAGKKFPEWLALENSIKMKTNNLEILGTTPLQSNIEYLHKIGFMDNNSLTSKGILATEINEMNSLITVTAYENKLFDSLSPIEILCIVSIFDNYRSSIISEPTQMDVYKQFETIRNELSSLELISSPDEYWYLTPDWMNPIMVWANGQEIEVICQTYELFPGNLIRVIMSAQNAIDELISIASYTSNVSLLEKLTEAKKLLIRNVLVADSLYLRN